MADPSATAGPSPIDHPDRIVSIPPTIQDADTSGPYPTRDKTRADFKPDEFTRVLGQHGKYVVWRKALLCPCFNATTGQMLLDCTDCDGSGYLYVDGVRIQALMLSFDKNTKIYEKFGTWLEGNVMVTVKPEYRLGYRDSIEMEDALMSFNELLKKNNRRGRRSKLPENMDSGRYRMTHVTRLAYRAEGSASFSILECGIHFEVSDDGWIHWLPTGNALVAQDTYYSVLYDFHPVFQVVSHPHASRDDVRGTNVPKDTAYALPLQAAAKLDYLIDVNAAPAPVAG